MEAGRHGVSCRRGLYTYSKNEYDRDRNGPRNPRLTRGRDRHANGYYNSSETAKLGGARDSSQRDGFSLAKDQELGQLHSRSRREDVVVYGSRVVDGKIAKSIFGVHQVALEKKRKFSPIVCDREEKKVKNSSKSRIVQCCRSTSLPESISVVSDGSVQIDPLVADQPQCMETSSIKPRVESGSEGSTVTECSPASSSSLSQGQCEGEGQEGEQMEDEEFVETRNILMSRWASESDSPTDSFVSDDEDMPKRKEMAHRRDVSEPLLDMLQTSSPECGEFLREDSKEYRSRSSGSVDGFGSPVSGDEYSDDESDNNDDTEIDEKHNADAVLRQLESHSEDDNDNNYDNYQKHEETVPKRNINMLQSSRSVFDYEKLNKINEGAYGVVYRAKDKQTGKIVALKKIKMGVERDGGFPLSSLREINILLSFRHPSIVNVKEVVMGDLDSVFMVMEYMEHDLKGMMEIMKQPFSASEVKCLMLQLLEGVRYLHDNWVLHRDLKSSNLLLNNRGDLKICDFGLSRQYGSPLKPYTSLVVTMWYRAPELLLGSKQYSTAIDMWSVGCIMAEMLSKETLFKGKSEVDQLDKIFRTLGTPNETMWPGLSKLPGSSAKFVNQSYNQLRQKFPAASFTGSPVLSESGFDLLSKLLTYNPEKRITADDALNHDWFREVPLPKHKDFMPTFPAQNEQDMCRNR